MRNHLTFGAVSGALLLLASPAIADNLSFTGSFTQDDQLQTFSFTLAAPSAVTFQTFGYAGGTNAAGQTIPLGGFDPWLSLFDSTGSLIGQNNDGTGFVGTDPNTGASLDSYFVEPSLGAGTYLLVLSQSDNGPNGPTFADGFHEQGNPTFTTAFGCSNQIFCDETFVDPYNNRTGNWAVDIDNISAATVPEPQPVLLTGAILFLGMVKLRRRVRTEAARG